MTKITVDGNTACANIAYMLSESAMIYPITPSSPMAEACDTKASNGEKNIFGNVLKIVELQSEGGASGALHGALVGGSLATTFTASQGLLLMIPNMYKIAGELLPCVMHVSARSLATHALSIFGDHSDVMAVRQTGFSLLCSSSVQEAQDLALVAHLSALESSVPFLHFFDGFRTSHEINTIDAIDMDTVKSLVPFDKIQEFKNRCLSSAHPHMQGTAQNPDIYFQNREANNKFYAKVPSIVQKVMNKVGKVIGRKYHLFDYYGDKNATDVVVMMGSGSETTRVVAEYLNKNNGKHYGVVTVRLYRPFSNQDLMNAIPMTTKRICVLDRTKESGASGEPLYKDVVSAVFDSGRKIKVIGGRYGLGGKDYTPAQAKAVFDNMTTKTPKNMFSVGIEDDVTHNSLDVDHTFHIQDNVTTCKFYGFGGDGTVSANKSSIKIIGNNTNYNAQAYFEYDSKKSGNTTICHLRFGKGHILAPYLLDTCDFVAIHKDIYLTKLNFINGLKPYSSLLINTAYNIDELSKVIPAPIRKYIANNHINLYTIDAFTLASNIGLGNKINLIMQAAFFKITNILPYEKAKSEMKLFAKKSYGSKGEAVLNKNYQAIDQAEKYLQKLDIPSDWQNAKDKCAGCKSSSGCKYYDTFIKPIEDLQGDSLPVSAFAPNGYVPTGTSQYEKRGIAEMIPQWDSTKCLQCNMCSFVCPHGAIRPRLMKESDLVNLKEEYKVLPAVAESGYKYVMLLSPKDCTGCGVCTTVCPALGKAIKMTKAETIRDFENEKFEYFRKIPTHTSSVWGKNTVKGSQFYQPYFEFSGACAGCGETPYIKVLSQLFGDRMIIANATGCSSIYGGSAPTCPYTHDKSGRGIAWANSLFEDNAEFGYGIKIAHKEKRARLLRDLDALRNADKKIASDINALFENDTYEEQKKFKVILDKYLSTAPQTELIQSIRQNADSVIEESVWILGGDGWAYDIGFGGLDHVIASGENINILVLDTEVYSNTGGQSSKSTPAGAVAKFAQSGKYTNKKDLGLIAMTYKNVYVAKVALGANMNQFIKALTEAESYDGVSIIIAYAPCINHGINMMGSNLEMKKAVESGYWQLYRFDPRDKVPFHLDSGDPTMSFIDFINGENRYRTLMASNPEKAQALQAKAKNNSEETLEIYKWLDQIKNRDVENLKNKQ